MRKINLVNSVLTEACFSYCTKLKNGSENLNRAKTNYLIDLVLTTLFLVVASTGLFMYFFIPSGIPRGKYIVYMGLTKATWLWLHSKAGILIVILIVIHLILHRQWIVRTTKNFFRKEEKDVIIKEKQ